eukprot:Gb_16411 [translate_table: standard]
MKRASLAADSFTFNSERAFRGRGLILMFALTAPNLTAVLYDFGGRDDHYLSPYSLQRIFGRFIGMNAGKLELFRAEDFKVSMGAGSSKSSGNSHGDEEAEDNLENAGGQLYVSLKMDCKLSGNLVPHVYGSVPLVGSWDPSKALAMERESTSRWEISFVVPPNHETLDFKFLLKPKHSGVPCIIEEGSNRLLTGGALHGDTGSALFRLHERDEILEHRVYIKADRVSPVDLAASWRAYQENLQPSVVRGIPDISIYAIPATGLEV